MLQGSELHKTYGHQKTNKLNSDVKTAFDWAECLALAVRPDVKVYAIRPSFQ